MTKASHKSAGKTAVKAAEKPAVAAEPVKVKVANAAAKDLQSAPAEIAEAKETVAVVSQSVGVSNPTPPKSIQELSSKALDAFHANASAAFDFVKALSKAKTMSEAIALQNEHARKQFEVLTAQAQEFSTLAQAIATASAAPIKEQINKVLNKG